MKKQIVLLIYVVALLLITGCSRIKIDQDNLTDIVFHSEKPGEQETISFVNPNGQSKQVYDSGRSFSLPVWSNDGERLFGLANHTDVGYPTSLEIKTGKMKKCKGGQYYHQIQDTANKNNPNEVILMDA